ncbi:MAG: hypothetical protein PHQ59_00175 [Candidatus Daviesbacteria bacterium]|nr:hypothetical protein [Candidatus Daviesbacteria bacterium]
MDNPESEKGKNLKQPTKHEPTLENAFGNKEWFNVENPDPKKLEFKPISEIIPGLGGIIKFFEGLRRKDIAKKVEEIKSPENTPLPQN